MLSMTACTPSSDPVLDQVLSSDLGELKLVQQEVKGYCFPTELFCSNPLFEPAFSAPASAEPLDICRKVISLQSQIGLMAYSYTGDFATRTPSINELEKICEKSLTETIENFDGSMSYPGMVLFDDGTVDGAGKVTVISRAENGSYFVVFSISRNLQRVGPIPFES